MTSSDTEDYVRIPIRTDRPELVSSAALQLDDATGSEIDERADRTIVYRETAPNDSLETIRRSTRDHLADSLDGVELTVERPSRVDPEDWSDRWKEFFEPIDMCESIRVGPPWSDLSAPPGGEALVVEPGMAFGTGHHETTRLCAQILEERLAPDDGPDRVLDVGCGSGILSLTAAELGAESVLGLDIAPEAIEAARANRARNQPDAEVAFAERPVGELDSTYGLVVANILAGELLDLREALVERVANGGALVLSGVLAEESEDLLRCFRPHGLDIEQRRTEGEWCALVLR
ncbi:MAG: 50S ribosomal protein L11 methyltransferase [Bradymonadaceae bacterium]